MTLRLISALGQSVAARLHAQAEGHVVEHRHVPEQRVVLEHEADLALAHVLVGRVLAVEQDAAVGRVLEAGDDAQQRRLAAARRAEQRDELAGRELEADIVERDEVAERLADVADFDAHGASGSWS